MKVGPTSAGTFDARIRQLIDGLPRLTAIVRPLLDARDVLRAQFAILHRMLLDLVRDDSVCRRLMTVLTARPVECGSLGRLRLDVRIVAGAAPQAVSADALADTLLKLFKVAVDA